MENMASSNAGIMNALLKSRCEAISRWQTHFVDKVNNGLRYSFRVFIVNVIEVAFFFCKETVRQYLKMSGVTGTMRKMAWIILIEMLNSLLLF